MFCFFRYETSLTYPNFQVNASCADGYTGKAVVRRCRRGGEPYEVSGCSAPKCLGLTKLTAIALLIC